MDEPTRVFVVPEEQADGLEAMLLMCGVEQRLPLNKIKVISNPHIPRDTIYIMPRGMPDPPVFESSFTWDDPTHGYGWFFDLSWRYAATPRFGQSSIASVVSDGGGTSPSSPSPPSSTSASVWKRLMGRLRSLLR